MLSVLGLTAQLLSGIPSDTPPPSPLPVRRRVQAVEISDWYYRRLTLHRRLSYATVPLFAFQWAAGRQIWNKGNTAPAWARTGHRVGATSIAGIFAVNTVTGVWNLWDSRVTPKGRTLRYVHSIAMLTADAGFTWAGAVLSEQAERDIGKRSLHRKVAISSMGISAISGVLMKVLNK
jgi:hypothetical protein